MQDQTENSSTLGFSNNFAHVTGTPPTPYMEFTISYWFVSIIELFLLH